MTKQEAIAQAVAEIEAQYAQAETPARDELGNTWRVGGRKRIRFDETIARLLETNPDLFV